MPSTGPKGRPKCIPKWTSKFLYEPLSSQLMERTRDCKGKYRMAYKFSNNRFLTDHGTWGRPNSTYCWQSENNTNSSSQSVQPGTLKGHQDKTKVWSQLDWCERRNLLMDASAQAFRKRCERRWRLCPIHGCRQRNGHCILMGENKWDQEYQKLRTRSYPRSSKNTGTRSFESPPMQKSILTGK